MHAHHLVKSFFIATKGTGSLSSAHIIPGEGLVFKVVSGVKIEQG